MSKILFWKNHKDILADPYGVYGLTAKSNILINIVFFYEEANYDRYKSWNRKKKKRGYGIDTEIFNKAIKSLKNYDITKEELTYYIPTKTPLPLLIKLTNNLFLAIAPKIAVSSPFFLNEG